MHGGNLPMKLNKKSFEKSEPWIIREEGKDIKIFSNSLDLDVPISPVCTFHTTSTYPGQEGMTFPLPNAKATAKFICYIHEMKSALELCLENLESAENSFNGFQKEPIFKGVKEARAILNKISEIKDEL